MLKPATRLSNGVVILLFVLLLANVPHGWSFAPSCWSSSSSLQQGSLSTSSTRLFAKKNKKKKAPGISTAALEALDALDEQDSPRRLSKKELLEQMKNKDATTSTATGHEVQKKQLSKKELMLEKALALEAMDDDPLEASSSDEHQQQQPKLSKKEMKALQKKQAKLEEKMAKKKAQKQANAAAESLNDDPDAGSSSPSSEQSPPVGVPAKTAVTLEDKIRKERPPPRIRVMETTQPGFTSLRLENVGIIFRNQHVLQDVTWGVQTGDRIGLVGMNGAGKTTQIRILAGELEPTTGDVVKSSKDVRVAVLRQEFVDELVPGRTLKEELMSVFALENAILQELAQAESDLEKTAPEDQGKMQDILDRMQDLQVKAEDKEVYTLESRVQKVMDLMGFTEDESEDLVATFSGGWKMRIGLGKVLLRDPNVLLLDEPTNNLDVESIEWLEDFLRQQNIPMVIVSHDREFLDQVCTKIVDAEGGICTEYDGNYSRFLQLKKSRLDSWQAAYNAQEKKIKEERSWMNKFKIKQPQAVKQRQAKLEKFMKSPEYVKKPPFLGKPFRFRFPDAPRLSPEVAEIKGLSHAYENEQSRNRLFDNVELFIEKGDRIAVVGPNGSGKSTLLRLLVGKETPDAGKAQLVGQNVVMSYFEQNQADALDLDKTVIETIQGASTNQSYNELRALLGQFLFKGDAVEKKVANLSGGEKARLSLCCMMLTPSNLLILDEPTNHIDVAAKEMLEEALQHFAGSVIVISHDRFFISRVATSIVAIEDKKLAKYQGDYKFYMERSQAFKEKLEARYVPGLQRIEAAPIIDLDAIERAGKKKSFGGAQNSHMVTRTDKGVKNAKRLQPK